MASSSSTPPAQGGSAINEVNLILTKLSSDRNSNNYKSWKDEMLCLVERHSLVGFIDGKTPPPQNDEIDYVVWRRSDLLLMRWILGALSDEVLHDVVHLGSARDLWLELENKFSSSTAPMAHQEKEWHEKLALHRAIVSGEWDTAKVIMEQDPSAVTARVSFTLETALHIAVGTGNSRSFVSKLVDFMSDDSSLAITDGLGYNPLHVAALTGNYHAAQILLRRVPDLLYVSCRHRQMFPIHLAAEAGHRQTLELLISHTRDDRPINPFAAEKGLVLLNFMIGAEFFDMALRLADKYPYLARMKPPSPSPSITTALNSMASRETTFCVEPQLNTWDRFVYTCLKVDMVESQVEVPTPQSFDIENQTCCTLVSGGNPPPLDPEPPRWRKLVSSLCKLIKHLLCLVPRIHRIREKKLMREQALQLVKCLCKHMESLKYEEASAIYGDAMLTAARLGINEVIEIIVGAFPPAIHSTDAPTNHNFLHLAVRNRCEKVFNLIYQTTNHRYHYLNKLDSSGNSILHLAATLAPLRKLNVVSGAALQMQREIQWFQEVHKFVSHHTRGLPNHDGKTAEMIFTEEHRNLKIEGQKWMKDTANSYMITAAFIATVVFAATIGCIESDSGSLLFYSKSRAFTMYMVSNAVCFFTSTTSLLMFLSILASRYAEQDFLYALPNRLCIGLVTLFFSILFMLAAFGSALYLVFGRKNGWVLIAVAALASLPVSSFVLLQFPLLIDVISSTYGRGIFGNQSDLLFH